MRMAMMRIRIVRVGMDQGCMRVRVGVRLASIPVEVVHVLVVPVMRVSVLVFERLMSIFVFMGLTQGILASMIADVAPADHRGTAFGVFNLVSGVALLAASVLAGALWDLHGPAWTFWTGAGCALLTLLLIPVLGRPVQSVRS